MKITKRLVLRACFAAEMVVCTFFYLFGAQGMSTLYRMKQDNNRLAMHVNEVRGQVKQLEMQIALWQTNDFYKEKKAREQLQMAHADDIVYYVG